MKDDEKNSILIKKIASRLGFNFCTIAKAEFLEEEANSLERWLKKGMHGEMTYMERYFDKRLDPMKLVPGAKSIICLMLNYYPKKDLGKSRNCYKIAKYAYGKDYHFVIKHKLRALLADIQEKIGRQIEGRGFVDSAPVMERAWARKSGLGWIGKNSLLLNRVYGSFVFLAELIITLPLKSDVSIGDYCGTCTRCINACPTKAIVNPRVIDSRKCIAYFTIEFKGKIPQYVKGNFDNWIFGCDICQDVCPWNKFSRPHSIPEFKPIPGVYTKKEWKEITEEIFQKIYKNSPLKRAKFRGMMRNIQFVNTP